MVEKSITTTADDDSWSRQVSCASGVTDVSRRYTEDKSKLTIAADDGDWSRQVSSESRVTLFSVQQSVADSTCHWKQAEQTLIFLDWDDTLFPTSEIFDRWGVPGRPEAWEKHKFTEAQEQYLENWRDAVLIYLRSVCAVSKRVVIVTNAKPGWVQNSTNFFHPRLNDIFARDDGPRIVYACEALRKCERHAAGSPRGNPALNVDSSLTDAELSDQLSRAKYMAMQLETKDFYSRYPGQTWKNIINVGDARYEHSAAQDLAFRRKGPDRERLRLKCIITPENPPIQDMIYRLNVAALLFPAYVAYDGDIDVDMNTPEQLRVVAQALRMPELETLIRPFPINLEDVGSLPDELDEVAVLVQNRLMDWRTGA